MNPVLGPCECLGCGDHVWFGRIGEVPMWMEPGSRTVEWMRHRCPRGQRCGVTMPRGDRCARLAGHAREHRSRHALDNARWAA